MRYKEKKYIFAKNKLLNMKAKNLTLLPENAQIYNNVDGLSLQNLFYVNSKGHFPDCYMFQRDYKSNKRLDVNNLFEEILKTYDDKDYEYVKYTTRNVDNDELDVGYCLFFKNDNIYMRVESQISESYVLYSHDNEEKLNEFLALILKFYVQPEEEKNNIWKIAQGQNGFYLKKGKVKEVENFSIEQSYNDDFLHESEKIAKFIAEENKSGLIILHGERGTGKTTYIRHLINSNPNRKFVYVSPDLVNSFGSPAFTSFLTSLTDHIIILEDCENIIRDRNNTGLSAGVSTLLNMSDGLLADDLGIKFICTFNADVKDIDSALMRKGRLISKYEFKPLTVEKTNALLELLYEKDDNTEIPKVNKGLTVADIYHFDDDSYDVVRKKII